MKTVEDLKVELAAISWFRRLGEPLDEPGIARVANLEPWAGAPDAEEDEAARALADAMDWLPTTRNQEDPIYGKLLEGQAKALGRYEGVRQEDLEVYKAALVSLRSMRPHPLLEVGPHKFTEAAKGAAAFAARRAALELIVNEPGFWCRAIFLYALGHWPLGVLPDRTIVVL
jgi:hypothetical protein